MPDNISGTRANGKKEGPKHCGSIPRETYCSETSRPRYPTVRSRVSGALGLRFGGIHCGTMFGMVTKMPAPSARRRALIVPREHGAWGILLVPMLTGAWVGLRAGGDGAGLAAFFVAALALFWLRTPVESWMGAAPIRARSPEEFRLVRMTACALAAVAAGALGWLFAGGERWTLLWIGGAVAVCFALQFGLKRTWRDARAASQIVGAAGLTATGPAAYFVATGRLDQMAWVLWATNFLFAANQIHFVQLRIHTAQVRSRGEKVAAGRWFLTGQVGLVVLLAIAGGAGVFSWGAAAAFAPVLARGFAWFASPPAPLAVQALGKSELLQAAVFCVLLALLVSGK
jgi:hypothetical protein